MPRVRQLTPELRREEERNRQIQRNYDIIRVAVRISDYKTVTALAKAMGVNCQTLHSSLRSGSIRAVDMSNVIRLLELDDDTIRALMGNPKRCRYEKGYVA